MRICRSQQARSRHLLYKGTTLKIRRMHVFPRLARYEDVQEKSGSEAGPPDQGLYRRTIQPKQNATLSSRPLRICMGSVKMNSNKFMLPVNASGCSNPTRPPVQQASVIFPLGILPSYSLCPSDSSKSCYMPIQQGLESTTGREPAQQISVMPPDSSTPVSSLHSSPCILHDGVLTACSQSSASYSQPLLPHYPLRGGSSSNFSTPSGTGTIALFVQICIVLALFHHVWSIPSKHPPLTATKFPPPCISRVPHTLQK